jgi:hypothetical protein
LFININAADTPEKRRIAEAVKQEAKAFLALGVPRIQEACNQEHERLAREWRSRPPDSLLSDYGLPDTPASRGLTELDRPFRLFKPERILIECVHDEWSDRPKTPMGAPTEPQVDQGIIYVFLRAIDAARLWSRYTDEINLSVAQATYHEMLHVCGDTKPDTSARHHLAGIVLIQGPRTASSFGAARGPTFFGGNPPAKRATAVSGVRPVAQERSMLHS